MLCLHQCKGPKRKKLNQVQSHDESSNGCKAKRNRKLNLYGNTDNHKIIITNRPMGEVYINENYVATKKTVKCRRCGLELENRSKMMKHWDEVHGSEVKKKEDGFKCRDCSEVLPSKAKLTSHRNEMHPRGLRRELRAMYTANDDSTEFTCGTCKELFRKREEVESHVTLHMKRYPCPSCDQVFLRSKFLALHSRHHSREDMYHCTDCDHKCKDYSGMAAHIDITHLKLYTVKCDICGKGFKGKFPYKIHFERYHSSIEVKCIVCTKVFQSHQGLLYHQRSTHFVSTSNADCCPICDKRFTNKFSLKVHVKTHNPEYLCNICGKKFYSKGCLESHMRVHSGETPFKCSYCEKSFRTSQNLRTHERVHTGEEPYTCEHCGKGFKQRQPLKIHRRLHTGERPYKCIICEKGFISNTALKNHKKSCPNKIIQDL